MAKKKKVVVNPALRDAAVKIGTALGKATRAARSVGESAPRTKKELASMKKSFNALAKELEAAAKRFKKALQ
jgi:hypothetical protein